MKKKLLTILLLLTTFLTVSAQDVKMKVQINDTIKVIDVDGHEVRLVGEIQLPYDAFISMEYFIEPIKGLKMVDLGLPSGTLWANFNYGATAPEMVGELLSWSEIGKVYDNWGKPFDEYWQAPTKEQMEELINECIWDAVNDNSGDLVGYNISNKTKTSSIFLPRSKYKEGDSYKGGDNSFYWTATEDGTNSEKSFHLYFNKEEKEIQSHDTKRMMAVRPVWHRPSVGLTLSRISEPTYSGASYKIDINANDEEYAKIEEIGLLFATTEDALASSTNKVKATISDRTATATLSGLTDGTDYFVRAYANLGGTNKVYSSVASFKTKQKVMSVSVGDANKITDKSASIPVSFTGDPLSDVTSYGILFSLDEGLVNSHDTNCGNSKGSGTPKATTTVELNELTPDTVYFYCAFAKFNGKDIYSEVKSFKTKEEEIGDPNYPKATPVNLGLSVKWASWNIGAKTVADMGKYIGWGVLSDSVIATDYSLYAADVTGDSIIAGNIDHDIAFAKWGEGWSMPTETQLLELNDCRWEETTVRDDNGNIINGFNVYGINGYEDNYIFIPLAGYRSGESYFQPNNSGNYWTANSSTTKFNAHAAHLSASGISIGNSTRNLGFSIRPVFSGETGDEGGNGEENTEPGYIDEETGAYVPKAAINMGTSVKWASWNIGYEENNVYGDYFSWGETEPKTSFENSDYVSDLKGQWGSDIKVLDDEHDVARKLWKRKWRMPTQTEVNELLMCEHQWIYNSELKTSGVEFKHNGKTVFLPAGGSYDPTNTTLGNQGFYWTSTPNKSSDKVKGRNYSVSIWFLSNDPGTFRDKERWYGLLIRPVWDDSLEDIQ